MPNRLIEETTWRFRGKAKAYNDVYDFNTKADRGLAAKGSTFAGAFGGGVAQALSASLIDPTDFEHIISGTIYIDESGSL